MSIKYENLGRTSKTSREKELDKRKEEMRLVSGAQVQNVSSTRVYVFGESDTLEEDEGDVEMSKLSIRSRHGNNDLDGYGSTSANRTKPPEEECFEKTIFESDTLQSIALQYRCPVAELKRINNLMQDQDFYALRTLKVPLKSHGYLKEMILKQREQEEKEKLHAEMRKKDGAIFHGTEAAQHDDEDTLFEQGPSSESEALLVRTLSIRGAMNNQSKQAKEFLAYMDKDLAKIRESTRIRMDSLEEVTQSLKCKRIYPLAPSEDKKLFDGADCGIRWWSVVAVILVVGLLLPVIYVIYFSVESKEESSP